MESNTRATRMARRKKAEIDSKLPPDQQFDLNLEPKNDPIFTDLSINESKLNEELLNQPIKYAKWVKLKAEASYKVKSIKNKLKLIEANIRFDLRQNIKGLRVADADAEVIRNSEVIKLKQDLIDAEQCFELYEGFVRGFQQRADMLKDLCSNKRRELVD